MRPLIQSLSEQNEELYLEFKSEWYWKGKTQDMKRWGEFLKDFAALVNCSPEHIEDNKYLIIGVDESKEKLDRFIDVNLSHIGFDSLEHLKDKVDEKLSNFFRFEDDTSIKDCYRIYREKFNGRQVVCFLINPVTSLLVLKKDLQDKNRTEKMGNVFIRKLKCDDEPEVANACPDIITSMHAKFKGFKKQVESEVNVSKNFKKTVALFLKKNSAFKEIGNFSEKKWKDKILFEVYNLSSDFSNDIDIIYLFNNANQVRTREYLISNGYISDKSIKFILVDDGANIDSERIKVKFSAKSVLTLSGFAREHLYNDLLDEESFHDGQFKKLRQIKNFIEPSTIGDKKKNALVMLNEWFTMSSKPLMVVKGYGGVGKTTLVKYFLDQVYLYNRDKEDGYRVVFIDSKRIIDEISTQGVIDDLFYFYSAHAKVNDFENRFNQELLELSVDNGNVLIVVDGIDEVIAKLSNRFDVVSFIDNIFDSYLIGNEKTKVILTCRDYFWDHSTEENHNISKLELSPFTEPLTRRFFQKEFEENSADFRKCMNYADEFKFETGDRKAKEYVYIPYTLDLIADMVKQNRDFGKINKHDIDTNILNVDLNDDYFIGRICNREIQKLKNVDVDSQLVFFMKLSAIHRGTIHESNLSDLLDHIDARDVTDISELFKGHTLVNYDHESGNVSFKYDFFKEFFVNLYICYFLSRKKIGLFENDVKKCITEYVKYNTSFTRKISSRVSFDDELEIFIMELIEIKIEDLKKCEDILSRRIISSLICILLSCHQQSNGHSSMSENTRILTDVFGDNLDYLSILNIFGKDSDKLIFDFRDKTISNAWMENYPFFWECKFDETTTFFKGVFKHLEPKSNFNIPTIHKDLFSNCNTGGIHEIIKSSNERKENKNDNIKTELIKIFRLFDTGGTFKEQKVEKIEKYADTILLKGLIKNKVIKPYQNPKKRAMRQYKVDDDYMDLINVLEQSGSNYELEKIVRMLS